MTRIQAYALDEGHAVTVSQVWPVPQAEDFVVSPSRVATATAAPSSPEVEWTREDPVTLNSSGVSRPSSPPWTSAQRPDQYVGGDEIQAITGRAAPSTAETSGGFGVVLKAPFRRSNAPYSVDYAAGDTYQQYYSVSPDIASMWTEIRGLDRPATTEAHDGHS